MDDDELRDLHIDRIYDTFIDEDELRICDETTQKIADELAAAAVFLARVHPRDGRVPRRSTAKTPDSIVLAAYEKDVPIFCPAFSDCSAGFGLVAHQHERGDQPKVEHRQRQGLLRADAAQDQEPDDRPVHDRRRRAEELHAGHRRGRRDPRRRRARCTSTPCRSPWPTCATGPSPAARSRKPRSWGKVDTVYEQMVFSEATLAVPLIAGYAYHKGAWKART